MSSYKDRLALYGGKPTRETWLAYGRQSIDNDDISAVIDVLKSDWLTTGPAITDFESDLCNATGAEFSVALSSGTAALHATMFAIEVSSNDEVIVPAITFAATANAVSYQGGTPVFVDVDPDTLLLDVSEVENKMTGKTKAIVCVDYAGQPGDYESLLRIAENSGVKIISDGCHSLGAEYKGRNVGSIADITTFSFHPVKHITCGEGGAITTDDESFADRIRTFRNHGIDADHHQRSRLGDHSYQMLELGYNYRLTDFQSALAKSQLSKLNYSVERRREIARIFDNEFDQMVGLSPLTLNPDVNHAYHLYVIKLDLAMLTVDRNKIFTALRAENIGVNVHYLPVYLHPYYANKGYVKGICPTAERAYETLISLPIFPTMSDQDIEDVICGVRKVLVNFID